MPDGQVPAIGGKRQLRRAGFLEGLFQLVSVAGESEKNDLPVAGLGCQEVARGI